MGSGASSLPKYLDESTCKRITGKNFDDNLFKRICKNGKAPKKDFITTLTELADVYLSYCRSVEDPNAGNEPESSDSPEGGEDGSESESDSDSDDDDDDDDDIDYQKVCKVNGSLKKRFNLKTFFDENAKPVEHCIDRSQCVVVFLTEEYLERVNDDDEEEKCEVEFFYSMKSKSLNRVVVVVLDAELVDRTKWIGKVGDALKNKSSYVDMSGDMNDRAYFSSKIEELNARVIQAISRPLHSMGDEIQTLINCPSEEQIAASMGMVVGRVGRSRSHSHSRAVSIEFGAVTLSKEAIAIESIVEDSTTALKDITVEDVGSLLEGIGLKTFRKLLVAKRVDGKILHDCVTVADVKKLGVSVLSKARLFLDKIETFKNVGVPQDLLFSAELARKDARAKALAEAECKQEASKKAAEERFLQEIRDLRAQAAQDAAAANGGCEEILQRAEGEVKRREEIFQQRKAGLEEKAARAHLEFEEKLRADAEAEEKVARKAEARALRKGEVTADAAGDSLEPKEPKAARKITFGGVEVQEVPDVDISNDSHPHDNNNNNNNTKSTNKSASIAEGEEGEGGGKGVLSSKLSLASIGTALLDSSAVSFASIPLGSAPGSPSAGGGDKEKEGGKITKSFLRKKSNKFYAAGGNSQGSLSQTDGERSVAGLLFGSDDDTDSDDSDSEKLKRQSLNKKSKTGKYSKKSAKGKGKKHKKRVIGRTRKTKEERSKEAVEKKIATQFEAWKVKLAAKGTSYPCCPSHYEMDLEPPVAADSTSTTAPNGSLRWRCSLCRRSNMDFPQDSLKSRCKFRCERTALKDAFLDGEKSGTTGNNTCCNNTTLCIGCFEGSRGLERFYCDDHLCHLSLFLYKPVISDKDGEPYKCSGCALEGSNALTPIFACTLNRWCTVMCLSCTHRRVG